MAVKYVKDFEFPAAAGFRDSAMPSRAGMSSKGMPSRAKPNAPARGAARMESAPKMGKGQGYAEGGRVKIQGRNQAEIKAAMAKANAQRKAFEASRREATAKRNAEIAARNAAKKAQPKSMSKQAGPVMAPDSIVSGRSVSKDFVPQTFQQIEMPSAKKPSYGKYGLQEYAKGGKVAKVMREYKAGKLHSGSKKGPMVKNPKQAMAIALSEARKSGEKVVKKAKGGQVPWSPFAHEREHYRPTPNLDLSRGSTAASAQQKAAWHKKYMDDTSHLRAQGLTEPQIREKVEQQEKSRKATIEQKFAEKEAKEAAAAKVAQKKAAQMAALKTVGRVAARAVPGVGLGMTAYDIYQAINQRKKPTVTVEEIPQGKARGGKVGKYAMGGAVDNYAGKTGPYRGSPKKAKMLGRQDRRAREAMERAEKHAPGRSIDMPDRKAHGGMMRRKVA